MKRLEKLIKLATLDPNEWKDLLRRLNHRASALTERGEEIEREREEDDPDYDDRDDDREISLHFDVEALFSDL